jgi:hypothetical protein
MNTEFKFNHESDTLSKSIGVDQSILEGLGPKIINMVKTFEKNSESDTHTDISVSKIIENLSTTFSDTEIAILAGIQIKDSIMEAQQKSMQRLPKELLEMLEGLKDRKDFDPDAN